MLINGCFQVIWQLIDQLAMLRNKLYSMDRHDVSCNAQVKRRTSIAKAIVLAQ